MDNNIASEILKQEKNDMDDDLQKLMLLIGLKSRAETSQVFRDKGHPSSVSKKGNKNVRTQNDKDVG